MTPSTFRNRPLTMRVVLELCVVEGGGAPPVRPPHVHARTNEQVHRALVALVRRVKEWGPPDSVDGLEVGAVEEQRHDAVIVAAAGRVVKRSASRIVPAVDVEPRAEQVVDRFVVV